MPLYFITGNIGKFAELQSFIPDIQHTHIDLPEIQEIDAKKIVTAKLQEALKYHIGEIIIEDTSLYLDCLNGLPGPLIKWFLKTIGTSGIAKLAYKLQNFQAVAKTIIGYAKNKDELYFFEGCTQGIVVSPRGSNGFGWDEIFQPEGQSKTFAEMDQEEKKRYSMRRQAAIELQQFLQK